jgi:hypothetical protein
VPVTWAFDAAARIVRVRYTEPYAFDEWHAMIEEFRARPGFPFQRDIGVLVDWTSLGVPCSDFRGRIASYVATFPLVLKGRRIAIVVNDQRAAPAAWQQAEVYEDAGAVSTVFRSRTDAERWLCDLTSHDVR